MLVNVREKKGGWKKSFSNSLSLGCSTNIVVMISIIQSSCHGLLLIFFNAILPKGLFINYVFQKGREPEPPSTNLKLIPSCLAYPPRIRSDRPCPACRCRRDIACHCRLTPDGGKYYCLSKPSVC